ncbi:MAG: DUF1320 domain-containing protein [Gammaproteobacteria bacterium]|nr:DUF1320 domain-containing protein [Gammaproteobacteria bacterium]
MTVHTVYATLSSVGSVYAAPAELLKVFRADELAQLSFPSAIVSGDLLRKAVSGESLDAETPEVQAAIAQAVNTLCHACQRADAMVNVALQSGSYLPDTALRDVLVGVACDLTRFFLWNKGELDQKSIVWRRYQAATKQLQDIQSGKYDRAMSDAEEDAPEFDAPDRIFSMDTLKDYG